MAFSHFVTFSFTEQRRKSQMDDPVNAISCDSRNRHQEQRKPRRGACSPSIPIQKHRQYSLRVLANSQHNTVCVQSNFPKVSCGRDPELLFSGSEFQIAWHTKMLDVDFLYLDRNRKGEDTAKRQKIRDIVRGFQSGMSNGKYSRNAFVVSWIFSSLSSNDVEMILIIAVHL